MANDEIGDICPEVVYNRAKSYIVEGLLAADTKPGQFVVFTSGTWTKAISTTSAHRILYGGVVIFRTRQNNAGTNIIDVDTSYDIDAEPALAEAGICIDGICACFLVDPAATTYPLTPLMVGTTAGSLKVFALESTGATSGTAAIALVVATLAKKVASGDTVGFIGLGSFAHKVFIE